MLVNLLEMLLNLECYLNLKIPWSIRLCTRAQQGLSAGDAIRQPTKKPTAPSANIVFVLYMVLYYLLLYSPDTRNCEPARLPAVMTLTLLRFECIYRFWSRRSASILYVCSRNVVIIPA